ncbi:hypothetical protein NA655_08570 [Pseudomonas kuykendallii]|uniref:Uncharacterized protein n=1 Tax=Pseudomonas kuykendallii TaxID=1007099 RepID=A0A1H3EJ95_9PSED|nr:hypothetical protein [Pseudomonas kuykendallii]MCQ4271073.1 hypothetical protein [Pseudomonas kuykendallii]SDX78853.1 hypothetical protein SAMN05216287_3749 [Pseudomonas kuykendallii]
MTNILTESRKALYDQLQTITVANGYRTNAGQNVRSGWLNEVLKEEGVSFPVIVLQPARGAAPVKGPNAFKLGKGFNVAGAVSVGMDYEDALDDIELDLIQCLVTEQGRFPKWLPLGVTALTLGAPESFPPGEGMLAAAVLLPVNLSTIVEGK